MEGGKNSVREVTVEKHSEAGRGVRQMLAGWLGLKEAAVRGAWTAVEPSGLLMLMVNVWKQQSIV